MDFGYEALTAYMICKYFLPFHGLPFHSVNWAFDAQRFEIFMYSVVF